MLTEEFFKQSYSDSLIKNQLAKLNEEKEEALIDKDQESSRKKLIDDIMVMEPAAVLKFISQQYDMSGKEFLLKNVGWLAAYLVKNNFIKAKEIAKSIKDFNVKNIDDNSDIDYSNVEIDEDTFKESSMFDNEKEIKAIEDFIKQYQETQQEAEKEAEKSIKDAENDIKDSGIDIPQEQIDNNTLDVLSVIDNEDNKDKSPEELSQLIKDKLEKENKEKEEKEQEKEKSDSDNKEPTTKKTPAKKTPAKKPAAKKVTAKSTTTKKPAAKTTTKSTATKKTTTKKPVEKATEKPAETTTEKPAEKTSTTKKTAAKKSAAKTTTKSTATKKLATKKPASKKAPEKSKKANESDFISAITPIAINEMLDAKLNEKSINGLNVSATQLAKELKIKNYNTDVAKYFAKTSSAQSIKAASGKINLQLKQFYAEYQDNPDEAVKNLLASGSNVKQKEILAELACKLVPDAENTFNDAGVSIDGVIDEKSSGIIDAIKNAKSGGADEDTVSSIEKRIPTDNNSKEVAELASDSEPKGFLGKFKSGLKQFGQAVAIAKLLKFAMNNAKTVTDMLGGLKMKFKEDANVVAEITTLVTNGEDSRSDNAETKFSIRFDSSDLKWHATNLDNRKMKIDGEEELIKKVLDTDRGKEFKKKCLDNWEKILKPNEKGNNVLVYILKNTDKLGIKLDKDMIKFTESILRIYDNFDEVKKQFS